MVSYTYIAILSFLDSFYKCIYILSILDDFLNIYPSSLSSMVYCIFLYPQYPRWFISTKCNKTEEHETKELIDQQCE